MITIPQLCPVCTTGPIGFRLCGDGRTLVLMCDECDSVWLLGAELRVETAHSPAWPDFMIPEIGCSVGSPGARWATWEDMGNAGIKDQLLKEGKGLSDMRQ